MQLTKEQRIFIVLEYETTKNCEQVRRALNETFPERNSPDTKTVYRTVGKFNEHGSISNRYKGNSGRKIIQRTENNTAIVQRAITENPTTSVRRNETNLSKSTFHRTLRKDIRLHPYQKQIKHELLPCPDPPLIKLRGGSMRPGIPPSIFNVPASCLPSPKPTPRPVKVEHQHQLRYFLQKDKITSFNAFKPERNLQKQYKNLTISRSKERLFEKTVRLAMNYDIPFDKTIQNVVTLLQAYTSSCVDTEKEKKLVFLTSQLELLSQKQFSMNEYWFALQSYPKCNYEQLRDFLMLPCKRKPGAEGNI
ncbi:Protein of unknown function DUF4817 [Trinorchestia longiramus]|nr:Protein of unknown function DUF4817 [Trinorchestia longiramus]